MNILIRPIQLEDAEAYLAMHLQIDQETKFMMLEPGERSRSVEDMRQRIQKELGSDNTRVFVAEDLDREVKPGLVGFLSAYGGAYRRNRETVYIVIGILEAYTGQGLGRRLFETMETWARGWGAHRLELTVMAHNTRGVALYQKMGFTIDGTLRDSLKVDGQYVDQYSMSKILD